MWEIFFFKKKWGKLKLKLNSQPTQCWKNKFNKDNLKKKTYGGNIVAKQKLCKGNTVVIHSIFFLKKQSYKANLSTSSIYKKNQQRLSKKNKRSQLWVKEMKKNIQKRKQKRKNKHVGKATVF